MPADLSVSLIGRYCSHVCSPSTPARELSPHPGASLCRHDDCLSNWHVTADRDVLPEPSEFLGWHLERPGRAVPKPSALSCACFGRPSSAVSAPGTCAFCLVEALHAQAWLTSCIPHQPADLTWGFLPLPVNVGTIDQQACQHMHRISLKPISCYRQACRQDRLLLVTIPAMPGSIPSGPSHP